MRSDSDQLAWNSKIFFPLLQHAFPAASGAIVPPIDPTREIRLVYGSD